MTEAGAAALTGTISGVVTGLTTSMPIDKVAVYATTGNTFADGGAGTLTATGSSTGTFTFATVPIGAYTLMFTRTGYKTMTLPGVGVTVKNTTNVSVALATDTTNSDGLAVTVPNNFAAGYGAPVTLTATGTSTDTSAGALTYSWAQTSGASATLTGASTNAVSFTSLTLASAKLEANPTAGLGPFAGGGGPYVPARFGPMGIGIDETGNYGFTVTVTDAAGHSVSASASVQATSTGLGLRNAPVGVPIWFEGDSFNPTTSAAVTTWAWTLTPPSGSKATLSSATTQFPSFTPDVAGTYTIAESSGGESTSVYVGDWNGAMGVPGSPGTGQDYMTQNCTAGPCHSGPPQFPWPGLSTTVKAPNMFTPYMATNMATAFERKLDKYPPHFGAACAPCHTLGWNPAKSEANNGFDNASADAGYGWPTTPDAGNYAAFVAADPGLARLSGIQCENCHGPKNVNIMGIDDYAAKTFSGDNCAPCHNDAPFAAGSPDHDQVGPWKTSLHANRQVAINEGPSSNCGRCHSAQGFAMYTQELLAGCGAAGSSNCQLTSDGNPPVDGGANAADAATLAYMGLTTTSAEPQTCAACHDSHGVAGNPLLLRVYDKLPAGVTLMNGVTPSGVGAGLTCMVCHNSRPSYAEVDDYSIAANKLTATSSIVTPHNTTQTDVFYGVNAYFMGKGPVSMPSPHLAVTDSCAGCHEAIPTATQKAQNRSSNHSFITDTSICVTCHGTGSTLVDGDALMGAIDTQLSTLDKTIFSAYSTVLGAATGGYNTTFVDVSTYTTPGGPYNLCNAALSPYLPMTAVPVTYAPFAMTAGPPVHTAPWRSLSSVEVTLPAGSLPAGLVECIVPRGSSTGTLVSGATYAGGPLIMSISNAQAGAAHSSSNAPIFSAISWTGRAVYNEALLNNDLSHGIHNLPFYQAVINNTLLALGNVTATTP